MNLLEQEPQPQPSYRLIELTGGLFAKVSPHRFEYLNQFKWQALKKQGWQVLRDTCRSRNK